MKSLKANVLNAGGGIVDLVLDRDADEYPAEGQEVIVIWLTREDAGSNDPPETAR